MDKTKVIEELEEKLKYCSETISNLIKVRFPVLIDANRIKNSALSNFSDKEYDECTEALKLENLLRAYLERKFNERDKLNADIKILNDKKEEEPKMTTTNKKYYTKVKRYNCSDPISIYGDNKRLSEVLRQLEQIKCKTWEVSGKEIPFYGRVMSIMEELRVLACSSIRNRTEDCILEQMEESFSKISNSYHINRLFEGSYYDPKTDKHIKYKLEDIPLEVCSADSDINPPPLYPLVIEREDMTLKYLISVIHD